MVYKMRAQMPKYLAVSLVMLFSITLISFASSPTGVAFPKVNPSHVFLYLNSTDYINYSITVYNGTASNVTVGTSPALAPYGINIGFIPNSGLPPYSGKYDSRLTPMRLPETILHIWQRAHQCPIPTVWLQYI